MGMQSMHKLGGATTNGRVRTTIVWVKMPMLSSKDHYSRDPVLVQTGMAFGTTVSFSAFWHFRSAVVLVNLPGWYWAERSSSSLS
jgi:hypothetical protein